jgi:O-glycosyl hydrolase
MYEEQESAFRSIFVPSSLIIILLALLCTFIQPGQAESSVHSWVSSSNMIQRLSPQPPLNFVAGLSDAKTIIRVDPGRTFQSILGLGSSLEHSTCYNISKLPQEQQAKVVESLVHTEKGIGMSLMRICIGTPDFTASGWYSYDDVPVGQTDPELEHFSINNDRQYVLPILRLVLQENPGLILFASAWSPPGWMKTNRELCGGRIDPKYFPSLARYFARFIEAYAAEGINIYAITPQNEPGYHPNSYPTCGWTAEQQRDFIRDYLGPEFQTRGISTKIWCYDHNFNNLRFPSTILRDAGAARYVDGIAFHHYEGKASAMMTLSNQFPDKHVYFTEGSVFGVEGATQIVEFLRNGARSYNAWVTVIDHKGQPNRGPHDCSPTCIVLNSDNLTLDYRFDYYMYGQFMKFIRPGAVRVHSNEPSKQLSNCAVRNSDGSIALVVVNHKTESSRFDIEWNSMHLTTDVLGNSVVTYQWDGSGN